MIESREYLVGKDEGGSRLDLFLSVKTSRSRAFIKHQIKSNAVFINRQVASKPSQKIFAQDLIQIHFTEDTPTGLVPIEKDLEILWEDEDLLVINKAQGWVVHPTPSYGGETMVNYLLYHMRNSPKFSQTSQDRPGIVHRLDRGTSGCLIVAKNRIALEKLSAQFKIRSINKHYEAIVFGRIAEEGTCNKAIGRHPVDRKRMSTKSKVARDALTRWKRVGEFSHFSIVDLFPLTGRTHQLRVHLSEVGHGIVGDSLYGRRAAMRMLHAVDRVFFEELKTIKFPFLHARSVRFFHPSTGDLLAVQASRPESFDSFVTLIETHDAIGGDR